MDANNKNTGGKSLGKLYLGDCLEVMKEIPEGSVDMVLADLPYGTTACKWDEVIPMEPLWEQYNRVTKQNAAIVLFGSQPFTAVLIVSNLQMFKYEWIWVKATGSNFATLKYGPMKAHENILVFSKGRHKYLPIKEPRAAGGLKRLKTPYKSDTKAGEAASGGILTTRAGTTYEDLRHPFSVKYFNNRDRDRGYHPTQKPVALLEYLVKTYTNEGETVLDNVMGSGSTGVACKNLNRDFIGIEKEPKYFEIAKRRIEGTSPQTEMAVSL